MSRFDRTPETPALQELSSFRLFGEFEQIPHLFGKNDAYVMRSCKKELLSFIDVVKPSVGKRVMQLRFQSHRILREEESVNVEWKGH